MQPMEAEMNFLENAKSLSLYGVHMHPVRVRRCEFLIDFFFLFHHTPPHKKQNMVHLKDNYRSFSKLSIIILFINTTVVIVDTTQIKKD